MMINLQICVPKYHINIERLPFNDVLYLIIDLAYRVLLPSTFLITNPWN